MSLHVAYVVEAYPTFVVNEVRELRRQGIEVSLLSAFRPVAQSYADAEELRQESLYFPARYAGVARANLRALVRAPARYLSLIPFLATRGESLRLLLLGAFFAEACRARGVQHLHGTFGTRTTTLAFVVARLSGLGFSFTTHAYDLFGGNPSLVWKTAAARFMRTISAYNRAYLLSQYPALEPGKVRVLHLGVDLENWPVAGAGQPQTLVSVANLVPKKGHLRLIEACASLVQQHPGLRCEIVGEGPQRAELEQAIARHGLDGIVQLAGRLAPDAVRARVAAARVFVLACVDRAGSSDPRDGIPVALMEAMALGRAVVTTPVAGIPELVDERCGLLVPQDDAAALAHAIDGLLRDDARARAFGLAARRRVEENFALRQNVAKLADLFEEATAS